MPYHLQTLGCGIIQYVYVLLLLSQCFNGIAGKTDDQGRRVTHILRPHTTQPNPQALKGGLSHLPTPPTTDWEVSSMSGSFLSEGTLSDLDEAEALSSWEEEPLGTIDESLILSRVTSVGEADIEWSSEDEMADSIESLSMLDETPRAARTRAVDSEPSSRDSSVDVNR